MSSGMDSYGRREESVDPVPDRSSTNDLLIMLKKSDDTVISNMRARANIYAIVAEQVKDEQNALLDINTDYWSYINNADNRTEEASLPLGAVPSEAEYKRARF
jgi:hypothetical protein